MDWFSQEGAYALKLRIEDYWRALGHEVTVFLMEAAYHPAMRATRFDLRSDLINGLPRLRNQREQASDEGRQTSARCSENADSVVADPLTDNAATSASWPQRPNQGRDSDTAKRGASQMLSVAELRKRACELADTGRFNHWEEIGAAMEADGASSAIATLGADAVMRRMLNARCAMARSKKE